MRYVICIFLISISFYAQAFDPYEGGGGSICIPKNSSAQQELLTLDEVYYPSNDDTHTANQAKGLSPLVVKQDRRVDGLKSTNISESHAGLEVAKILKALRLSKPKTALLLENILMSLSDIFVVYHEFKTVFAAADSYTSLCEKGSIRSVIVSHSSGQTVLSLKAWNKLGFQSQQILILHELMRLATLSFDSTWFLSESEIMKMTMDIYHGKTQELTDEFQYSVYLDLDPVSIHLIQQEQKIQIASYLRKGDARKTYLIHSANRDIFIHGKREMTYNPNALAFNLLYLKKMPEYNALLPDALFWSKF